MGRGTASGAMNLRSTHGPSSRLSPLRPRVEATELCERAPRTDRPDRPAKVLPEPNEEFIDEEPVFLGDRRHKPLLSRLGGLRPHEPEAVAHPVHVGVRRNSRLAETVDKDAVRRLRADLRKLDELLVGPGNNSSVSLEEESTHLLNLARLLAVEADWLDQTLQVLSVRMRNPLRRVVLCEQLLRRLLGHLVPGPLGQNRGDQDEERVLPFCDDLCESRLPLAYVAGGKVPPRQVSHDEWDPLTDGRRGGQGPPPPCKSIP